MRPERHVLNMGEDGYPAHLMHSPDPPARLYVLGDPSSLVPAVAVVGARKATPYGLQAASAFSGWAARAGYVVVSGGAVGCDQAAHRAALETAGRTVSVMAGGADVFYPRGARGLFSDICRAGCIVSEHPWGTEPKRWSFRTRNRIIAWLSQALLVVEAALPSGTFSTADYMIDAGREVLAVPGSIYSEESRGPNRLIAQGATPVSDVSEFAAALTAAIGPPLDVEMASFVDPSCQDELVRALRAHASRPDDLARALGLDVLEVARRLGRLELAGQAVRYRDGRYGSVSARARRGEAEGR